MNYLISSYSKDNEILGTDCQRILENCTMVKVHNTINRMDKSLDFHNVDTVKVFSYSKLYIPETFKLVTTINRK